MTFLYRKIACRLTAFIIYHYFFLFLQNIYGLNGMLVACGLGFLRIMLFDRSLKGEIICADFVTNSTLAATWDRCNQLSVFSILSMFHFRKFDFRFCFQCPS